MQDHNPFSPPGARLAREPEASGVLLEPRGVPVSHGWRWIADGFALFRRSPGMWLLALLIFFAVLIALTTGMSMGMMAYFLAGGLLQAGAEPPDVSRWSQLPLGLAVFMFVMSVLVQVATAAMQGGLMCAARSVDTTGELDLGQVFCGLRPSRLGRLALGGGLYAVAYVGLQIAVEAGYEAWVRSLGLESLADLGATPVQAALMSILPDLTALALALPLMMAIFYFPALVVFHEVSVPAGFRMSFVACLRNVLPLFWYGIVAMLLLILGMLPLLLGLLVVMPVLVASVYCSYRDIFEYGEGEAAVAA